MADTVPIWRGRADNGRIKLDAPDDVTSLRRYVSRLDGKAIEMIVRPVSRRRSIDQNAWLWGCAYPLLAETLGYDAHEHETLHYACLTECFGTTFDQRFGRELPRVSSSKMSTKEFAQYMEWLVRWASVEHGCIIPLPNESESTPVPVHA